MAETVSYQQRDWLFLILTSLMQISTTLSEW